MGNKIIYNGEEYAGSIVNDAGVGEFTSNEGKKNPIGVNSERFNTYGGQYANVASGDYSHAEGNNTVASGDYGSHAEGQNSQATGISSHAEGTGCIASGYYAHAEGNGTRATGYQSHAEGSSTQATNEEAHAEGDNTIASGTTSHAEGANTQALGAKSHAEGEYCIAGKSGYTALGAHAEGNHTESYGVGSHSEGQHTSAQQSGAHAEGNYTVASGVASHAEGESCIAYGAHSHAGGYQTEATGSNSFVFGDNTNDGGYNNCLVVGDHTVASSSQQVVIGKYNVTDYYAQLIIGNGTTPTPTNDYTYDDKIFQAYGKTLSYEEGELIYYHYATYGAWNNQGLNRYWIWKAKTTVPVASPSNFNPYNDFNNHNQDATQMIYWEPVYQDVEPERIKIPHNANNLLFDEYKNLIIGDDHTVTRGSGALSNTILGSNNTLNNTQFCTVSGLHNTLNNAQFDIIEGKNNTINAVPNCHIEGFYNTIDNGGDNIHIEGGYNRTDGYVTNSHIEGGNYSYNNVTTYQNIPSSTYSPSTTTESGSTVLRNIITGGTYCAHAEGFGTSINAASHGAHVEGAAVISGDTIYYQVIEPGNPGAHVEGGGNYAGAGGLAYGHIEGYRNTVNYATSGGLGAPHVEGALNTLHSSYYCHVEGTENTVNNGSPYSHAEGYQNLLTNGGMYCHAEGYQNTITNGSAQCHIEGSSNLIQNTSDTSHAEGKNNTITSAKYAHVEGYSNAVINSQGGHAQNIGTIAFGQAQTVIGRYNDVDPSSTIDVTNAPYGEYAFIIGNGDGTSTTIQNISSYNSNNSYSVDDYCYTSNFVQKCIEATTGTFDQTKWKRLNATYNSTTSEAIVKDSSNALTVSWDGVLNVIGTNADIQINGTSVTSSGDIANSNISDAYSNSSTYNIGDYCIYNNTLYKCNTAISVAEDFDSTKWTATTIGAELLSIISRVSTLETALNGYSLADS